MPCVEFEVLAVTSMKNTVSRDMMPCSLVEIYGFGGSSCFHLHTPRNIPEERRSHQHRGGSLKSQSNRFHRNSGKFLLDYMTSHPHLPSKNIQTKICGTIILSTVLMGMKLDLLY
jgi:hypothetical protein